MEFPSSFINLTMNTLKTICHNFATKYFQKMTILQLQSRINIFASINQAIITLLLKNCQKENLKNWRKVSLLCSDYKILTNVLSNRLKPTFEHTISIEQTCGIPNRSIISNLFTIHETINHSNTKILTLLQSLQIKKKHLIKLTENCYTK